MTRDDRDTESANPSKSFKVGDFDRLSGFFTPVWESKKRIRSESPIPASSPVSSSNGSVARPAKPTPAADIKAPGAPPETAPTDASGSAAGSSALAATPEPRPAGLDAPPPIEPRAPLVEIKSLEPAQIEAGPAPAGASSTVAPTLAPGRGNSKPAQPAAAAPAAAAASPALRASTAALKQAGPNLPAEAFFDREPEFRVAAPPAPLGTRSERGTPINHRSVRASVAATRVHEQLRARSRIDSLDTPNPQRAADTDREAALAVAQASGATGAIEEPHPVHLLRRLRRTIHLATPVPESVRAMIARFSRN